MVTLLRVRPSLAMTAWTMRGVGALAAAWTAAFLAACPAEPLDDSSWPGFDIVPYDATPGDRHDLAGAPTCAPESIVDLNATATRTGDVLTLLVDTTGARNDLHPMCADLDSGEVVLRYTVPPLSDHTVAAIRVSTITAATIANGSADMQPLVADPTTFDTMCCTSASGATAPDANCNNDAFVPGRRYGRREDYAALGDVHGAVAARRRDADHRGRLRRRVRDCAAHRGRVPAKLGVLDAPCIPVPPERQMDPTAPTAYFRCPLPDIQCLPGAAPDGTDLCVPLVPLGGPCDSEGHYNMCVGTMDGIACAQDPITGGEGVCALPGTVPGAPCRGGIGVVGCDPGLACVPSNDPRVAGACVPIVEAGQLCDPAIIMPRNHCDTGLMCCGVIADAGSPTRCGVPGPGCFPPTP